MDEYNNQETSEQELEAAEELSFTDKLVGIFTEPTNTFAQTAKFPPKTTDWLLPFFLLLLTVVISQFVMNSIPEVRMKIREQTMEQMDKNLQKQIDDGLMTKEQAKEIREQTETRMDSMGGGVAMIIQSASILIIGFLFFFIICGIYFLCIKFLLRENANYSGVLVANGLAAYIGIIQIILATILTFILNEPFRDTSLASFMNSDKSTFSGVLFGKIDLFSIWSYIVLSIGMAKMSFAKDVKKFFMLVFGLWIGWSLFAFFVLKNVPFIGNFM